jgi:cystine transport system substrate-binding protein
MVGNPVRRRRLPAAALALLASLIAIAAAAQDLGTIEPGKLHVALAGEMPMTALDDGRVSGVDGDLLSIIVGNLDVQLIPHEMDWASEIEAVAAGRVDLMIGEVGWTKERSQVMLLSDPIYYFGVFLAQKTTHDWHTFADLAGKTVGAVTGFSFVPELKTVPGIGEVKLYDTSDAAMRDLVAGRLDVAILDPPLVALAIEEHPEWGLRQLPLDPDPAFPVMSTKYNAVIAIRKDAAGLADAINRQIAELWATCANERVMAKYGIADASFFTPPDPNPRVGVDRPEEWTSPTLNPSCAVGASAATTP